MVSLNRLIHLGIMRMNLHSSKKFLLHDNHLLNRFLQNRTLVFCRNNRLNLSDERIIFHKYSTKTPGVLVDSRPRGEKNEVKTILSKDEDEDDFDDDDEEDDVDVDDDDDDDDDDGDDDGDNDDLVQQGEQSKEEIFEEIAEGNPDILKKLKVLEFEIAVLNEQGVQVPSQLKKSEWKELLENFGTSLYYKKKMLTFMRLNEKLRLLNLRKKQYQCQKGLKRKAEDGFHFYGIGGHSVLPKVFPNRIKRLLHFRNLMAEQKILLDCSYQEFMTTKGIKNLGKQILIALSESQIHRYPCQIAFCNLDKNDPLGKIITSYVPKIFDETFYCDVSSQGILDTYPKEKLVYLSPHSQNDLFEVNKNDIYVIGAFVDKGMRVKASLAKAKRDGIRTARLPIDHYLCWKHGDKALPINVVINVILDMFFYNDWSIAFKNISNRSTNDIFSRKKFFSDDIESEELK